MENDNNGQFLSPSLNYILNQAYSQGPYSHQFVGLLSSQRPRQVHFLRGGHRRPYRGMTARMQIKRVSSCSLPQATMGLEPVRWVHPRPPKTRSRSATIRTAAGSAPDTMMSGSSRGPTDDGRIKPDVVAPGYVLLRAQEVGTPVAPPWSNQYY